MHNGIKLQMMRDLLFFKNKLNLYYFSSLILSLSQQNMIAVLIAKTVVPIAINQKLLCLLIKSYLTMGNGNSLCGNPTVMSAHNQYLLDFFSQTPLFNAEEIKFPLSTKGIKIVDSRGRRVKLAGGNWSGAHMCRHCVDGLEFRKMRDIAMDIRYKFQMNCIRLTYSLQLYFDNKPVPAKYLTANPELIGKTGMEIFDITVQTLTEVGLMVILNNHTSTSQWCCSNEDGDGLWWSRQFPECTFFDCAEAFAHRYRDNPRVIGMDLRNELRKAHGLSATWGDNNPLTDWKRAAKICSDKVQKIAPHWLIFVAGLDYQLDLTPVHQSPLVLSVPNKLVYTGHFYGFSWVSPQITSWNLVSYQQFKQKFFNTQTSVRALGYPYFLGEFGNNQRDIPWKYLMRYLKETDIDWTYWALDGFKCEPSDDQTFGVFTNNFKDARHPDMLQDMIEVGPPAGTKPILPNQVETRANFEGREVQNHHQQRFNYQQQPQLQQQLHQHPMKYQQFQQQPKQVARQQYIQQPYQQGYQPVQNQQKIQLVQNKRFNQPYMGNQQEVNQQYQRGPQDINFAVGQGFTGTRYEQFAPQQNLPTQNNTGNKSMGPNFPTIPHLQDQNRGKLY